VILAQEKYESFVNNCIIDIIKTIKSAITLLKTYISFRETMPLDNYMEDTIQSINNYNEMLRMLSDTAFLISSELEYVKHTNKENLNILLSVLKNLSERILHSALTMPQDSMRTEISNCVSAIYSIIEKKYAASIYPPLEYKMFLMQVAPIEFLLSNKKNNIENIIISIILSHPGEVIYLSTLLSELSIRKIHIKPKKVKKIAKKNGCRILVIDGKEVITGRQTIREEDQRKVINFAILQHRAEGKNYVVLSDIIQRFGWGELRARTTLRELCDLGIASIVRDENLSERFYFYTLF